MARKARKQQYVARSGAKQWKPSIEWAMLLSESNEGFVSRAVAHNPASSPMHADMNANRAVLQRCMVRNNWR